jgi:Ala-tRNA(Pro) deacylase
MAIAITLKSFLDRNHVDYDMVPHEHSASSLESAHRAHVPSHEMVKAVVLEDANGYVVGIVPSTNHLDLAWVSDSLGRNLGLADEHELPALFDDCELGAVPALSNAYGLELIWDDQLSSVSDVYFEAGDHENLVHLKGDEFRELMAGMPHSIISAQSEYSVIPRL